MTRRITGHVLHLVPGALPEAFPGSLAAFPELTGPGATGGRAPAGASPAGQGGAAAPGEALTGSGCRVPAARTCPAPSLAPTFPTFRPAADTAPSPAPSGGHWAEEPRTAAPGGCRERDRDWNSCKKYQKVGLKRRRNEGRLQLPSPEPNSRSLFVPLLPAARAAPRVLLPHVGLRAEIPAVAGSPWLCTLFKSLGHRSSQ